MIHLSDSLRARLTTLRDDYIIADMLLNDTFTHTRECDYLTIRRDGSMSFLPAGRELVRSEYDRWAKDGRQAGRPNRVIRKVFTDEALNTLCDADFASFMDALNAVNLEGDIKLVFGDDIEYWYDGDNYAPRSGSLNNSCMMYEPERTKLYSENPDAVGLLCLIDEDEYLRARALVWRTTRGVFMDRVYGNPDAETAFRAFASDHEWAIRDTHGDPYVAPIGNWDQVSRPPYLDTFRNIVRPIYVSTQSLSDEQESTLPAYPLPEDVYGTFLEPRMPPQLRDDVPLAKTRRSYQPITIIRMWDGNGEDGEYYADDDYDDYEDDDD